MFFTIPGHATGRNSHLAGFDEIGQHIGNFGRDAMAVDFPIRPRMAQKTPLFHQRQRLPDFLHYGTERIHDGTPVAALNRRKLCLATNQAK